jgi:hypothetical protein
MSGSVERLEVNSLPNQTGGFSRLSGQMFHQFNPTDYQPLSNEIAIEELLQSDKVKKRKYNDAIFWGEIENSKRHGKGIMKYVHGRVYEGDWKNDMRCGRGFEKHANGDTYIGEFRNGKPEGHGIRTWV